MSKTDIVEQWYDASYKADGFNAQRRYPNEEMLRFFGRNYFDVNLPVNNSDIRVLELGCGSCANLWALAAEGYDVHGIDLSEQSLALGRQMLSSWDVSATLKKASFSEIPYDDNYFDVVFDVFSLNCTDDYDFTNSLIEARRVIKPNGKFFSYTPGKKSTSYINPGDSNFIDDYTLDGITREGAPFFGNKYPFHFFSEEEYVARLRELMFDIDYVETVSRTYSRGSEYFEFIVVEAICPSEWK